MKIAVIGGGSTYTPELLQGFLARARMLNLEELWLMDTDPQRLEVVGGFTSRIAAAQKAPFRVICTSKLDAAVAGASHVITQLRVGKMPARLADEELGRRHGLIGQETTGVGGMAKALRTIPVILGVAAAMRKHAPGARLINFTNPAGLVTEALARHATDIPAVGVCNVPITVKMTILGRLEKLTGESIHPQRAQLDTLGLNHLTWHRGFHLDGMDIWEQVLGAYLAELHSNPQPEWEPWLIEAMGMLPNYYLHYYYHTAHKLAEQASQPTRAGVVMGVEEALLKLYADPSQVTIPADLMQRGGAYYSTAAVQLITAEVCNLGETHVVNVPHHGAVPGWDPTWVLEMPCRVDRDGIHPLPAEPLPPACFGLLAQVKSYELLTVEAAIHGDRQAALLALLAHPLGPQADRAEAVLDDLLETNRQHLPQFFGGQP